MSLPRYAEYKDSGVEWLGEVPGHWEVNSVKRFATFIYGDALPTDVRNEDGDVPVFGSNGSFGQHDQPNTEAPAILVGRKGSCGALNWSDIPAFAIDTVYYIDSRNCMANLRWCFWALHTANLAGISQDTGVPGLSRDIAHNTKLPVPTIPEQSAIAAFLDRETGKIDALLAEQEKLITLLKEKRQAVISHAVTKGLNPNALMKDSGIEWLGEVPAHWEVRRVKDVARLESGHTPSKQVPEYWEDCDIPWVSLNDSKQLAVCDYITETAVQINHLGLANSSARMLPEGAVVFTRDATIGLAAITTRPMAVSQHLIAWCPSEKMDALYLLRVFNTMKPFLDACTFGATIKTIGMADVKKLVTPVPSRHEQQMITSFLDTETAKFDTLTAEANRTITLLQERRSALISAAVTGKIDVRHM